MYKIKQQNSDFIVDEALDCEFSQNPKKDFSIYKLTKEQLNTIQVIDMLTKKLRFKSNDIGYAGIKDKYGITTQFISLPNVERAKNIESPHENITLEHVGYLHHSINGKILVGNNFKIIVRNAEDYSVIKKDWMLNYFGEQRFSKNNVDVGRLLIQQKFKYATQAMLTFAGENPTYNERLITQALDKKPTDFVGALRRLPGRTLAFYIHAYQSYMFNLLLSKFVEHPTHEDKNIWATFTNQKPNIDNETKLPVLGFYYKPQEYSEHIQNLMKNIMSDENINPRSFIIRAMTEITEPGAVRQAVVGINDLTVKDEGETKKLSFFLPKGSYATIALRQLLTTKK